MQGPTGWWPEPSGAHPLRYFEDGDPTAWVSDGLRPPRRLPPATLPPPPSSGPGTPAREDQAAGPRDDRGPRPVGWYQNVVNPLVQVLGRAAMDRDAPGDPSPAAAQPAGEPPPASVSRKRRPRSVLTIAEALAIALALVAVITFAFKASGPVHTAARARFDRPGTLNGPTPHWVALPTTTVPSVGDQVAQWWTSAGGPTSAVLSTGLQVLQGDGSDVAGLPGDCTQFGDAVVSATSAAPPPTRRSPVSGSWPCPPRNGWPPDVPLSGTRACRPTSSPRCTPSGISPTRSVPTWQDGTP